MNLAGGGDSGHFGNFIEALRANKQEKLNCDIEVGFKSTVLPHLSNISYRLKRELKWLGSHRHAVFHLHGADEAQLEQHYKRVCAHFNWPAVY